MRSIFVVVPAVAVTLAACEHKAQSPVSNVDGPPKVAKQKVIPKKVIKIIVTAAGEVSADGDPVTMKELALKLIDTKVSNGEVWYHRESPEEEEPHPIAMDVIDLVGRIKLPVRLSLKRDFSEFVDGQGNSRRD